MKNGCHWFRNAAAAGSLTVPGVNRTISPSILFIILSQDWERKHVWYQRQPGQRWMIHLRLYHYRLSKNPVHKCLIQPDSGQQMLHHRVKHWRLWLTAVRLQSIIMPAETWYIIRYPLCGSFDRRSVQSTENLFGYGPNRYEEILWWTHGSHPG